MPTVLDMVKRLRAAQAAREGAELQRLVSAYAAIDRMAKREAEALALKLMDKYAGTNGPTANELRKLARYREMMETVQGELEEYQAFMKFELRNQSTLSITEGERDARILAQLAAREVGVSAQFRALNPQVIEQLVGFLDPQGPLYERLKLLSQWTADQTSQAILEGVARGWNPRVTARALTKTLTNGTEKALGMGLSDALRTMRTCQLWSYREAARASYRENADVVTGWVWYAELGSACPVCTALHGSEHSNEETLEGHFNCRCSPVPRIIGAKNPVSISGEEWFKNVDEKTQRDILGSHYDGWKAGKFSLSDIVGEEHNETYGRMRVQKSLKDLTGEG